MILRTRASDLLGVMLNTFQVFDLPDGDVLAAANLLRVDLPALDAAIKPRGIGLGVTLSE